jgi:serine protease Do
MGSGGGIDMGFYDQPEFDQPKKRPSIILVSIISSIIGGLIVLMLTPLLYRNGFFDFATGNNENMNYQITGPVQTTTVKVDSDIIKAVEKVRPAVVGIENFGVSDDPFNPDQISTGSGIVFEKANGKALIVTNYHVIENSKELRVIIPKGDQKKSVPAKVLGADSITDLAVLEIPDTYVTKVAEFGNSDALRAGEPAIAIGNPLGLELSQSVTVGVISSPKRTIDVTDRMATDVIQTDAAINPGNSGGPLVNVAGQVIGINTFKFAEKGVEGLGFAIPVNEARPVIAKLIKYGRVPRPYLGVSLVDLQDLPLSSLQDLNLPPSVQGGVVIRDIDPGMPADRAGLEVKDVIVALDNQPIMNSSELRRYLYTKKSIGDTVTITYYRDGQKRTTTAKLAESPNQ